MLVGLYWVCPSQSLPRQCVRATAVKTPRHTVFGRVGKRSFFSRTYTPVLPTSFRLPAPRSSKRGPQLDGSVFEYIYEAKGRVWIVGEHTAEGPASEPFILVPDESGLGWSVHVIYEDAAELESIVVQNNGDFGAWIRHLKLHDNGWTGPLYLHKSSDGGRTWRLVGRTNNAPANQAAGFKKIETQTATWRVADQGNGVSVVERRTDEHSAWKTVYRFPPNVCGP